MPTYLNRKKLDRELDGILELQVDPLRIAYVDRDQGDRTICERGLPEYILVYESVPPARRQEPRLYAIPHKRLEKGPEEIWLQCRDATVILISKTEDDRFRKENRTVIQAVENLCVSKDRL